MSDLGTRVESTEFKLFTHIPEHRNHPDLDPNKEWRIVEYLEAKKIPYKLGEPVTFEMIFGRQIPVYFPERFFGQVNEEWQNQG